MLNLEAIIHQNIISQRYKHFPMEDSDNNLPYNCTGKEQKKKEDENNIRNLMSFHNLGL